MNAGRLVIVLVTAAVFAALPGTASAIFVPPCTIIGTPGNDVLVGTMGSDVICGRGGADKIWGRGGNDYLLGGWGDDAIHGERGADWLRGEWGRDLLFGERGDDRLNSRDNFFTEINRGGRGHDRCVTDDGHSDQTVSCRIVDHF